MLGNKGGGTPKIVSGSLASRHDPHMNQVRDVDNPSGPFSNPMARPSNMPRLPLGRGRGVVGATSSRLVRDSFEFDDESDMVSISIPPSNDGVESDNNDDDDDDDDDDDEEEEEEEDSDSNYRVEDQGLPNCRPGFVGNPPMNNSMEDQWLVTQPMPGGPEDGTVIPSYGGHVANWIWKGMERDILKAYTMPPEIYTLLLDVLSDMHPSAVNIVRKSGLSYLPSSMFADLDMPLITAFVERWQPDTNSFHLPFGEMTIMLHDVWHIFSLPVQGDLPYDDIERSDNKDVSVKRYLMRLFNYDEREFYGSKIYHNNRVNIGSLLKLCRNHTIEPTAKAEAWLLAFSGACLFPDNSCKNSVVLDHYLNICSSKVQFTSWGTMTLAYLYRHLGKASRSCSVGIGGCLTLLQVWIYEYFPCFRPHTHDEVHGASWDVTQAKKDLSRLISIRRRLDALKANEVTWCPYEANPVSSCPRTAYYGCIGYYDMVEPYMPDRCLRQLGYVQKIPMPILQPLSTVRSYEYIAYMVTFGHNALAGWKRFGASRIHMDAYTRCTRTRPDEEHIGYSIWFAKKSHRFLLPQTSAPPDSDWWLGEFYRHLSPLLSMPNEQVALSPHWRELKRLGQLYGEKKRFLRRG